MVLAWVSLKVTVKISVGAASSKGSNGDTVPSKMTHAHGCG